MFSLAKSKKSLRDDRQVFQFHQQWFDFPERTARLYLHCSCRIAINDQGGAGWDTQPNNPKS
jgi:hypothetical protein